MKKIFLPDNVLQNSTSKQIKCTWKNKRLYGYISENCNHIIDDVVLNGNEEVGKFQTFLEIETIEGSLVVENSTVTIFGHPNLKNVGGSSSSEFPSIFFKDNKNLRTIHLRKIKRITVSAKQKYGVTAMNCSKLNIDVRQLEIFLKALENDKKKFNMDIEVALRFDRNMFDELIPFLIFMVMLFFTVLFVFIVSERDHAYLKMKEKSMLDQFVNMRNSILATEILFQTPRSRKVSFDKPVLQAWPKNITWSQKISTILKSKVK